MCTAEEALPDLLIYILFILPGGNVFYIYHDAFTCGACNKQLMDMLEFIQHKALRKF